MPAAPLICPRCEPASPLSSGAGVLDEAVCPGCQGRLLEAPAVQRVMAELGHDVLFIRDLAEHYAGGSDQRCPGCEGSSRRFELRSSWVELCFTCGALWLDAGELARLSGGRHRELQASPPEPDVVEEEQQPPVSSLISVNRRGNAKLRGAADVHLVRAGLGWSAALPVLGLFAAASMASAPLMALVWGAGAAYASVKAFRRLRDGGRVGSFEIDRVSKSVVHTESWAGLIPMRRQVCALADVVGVRATLTSSKLDGEPIDAPRVLPFIEARDGRSIRLSVHGVPGGHATGTKLTEELSAALTEAGAVLTSDMAEHDEGGASAETTAEEERDG